MIFLSCLTVAFTALMFYSVLALQIGLRLPDQRDRGMKRWAIRVVLLAVLGVYACIAVTFHPTRLQVHHVLMWILSTFP